MSAHILDCINFTIHIFKTQNCHELRWKILIYICIKENLLAISGGWFFPRPSLLIFCVVLLLSRKQVSSSRASLSFMFFVSFRRPQIHASLQSQIRSFSVSKHNNVIVAALWKEPRYWVLKKKTKKFYCFITV